MTRKTSSSLNVDRHVGSRIRYYRMLNNLSQHELAQILSISYQQLHKYENGTNSVSASRLAEIASALSIRVSDLFAEMDNGDAQSQSGINSFGREQWLLMNYLKRIDDSKKREALCSLLQSLSKTT